MKSAISVFVVLLTFFLHTLSVHAEETADLRIAVVNTPQQSGLMTYLLTDFEQQSGLKVTLYSGEDVYQHARQGFTDLVISHYGKSGMQEFVQEGLGSWPQMVFSNQLIIVGPKSDPAQIKTAKSAAQAFKQIAEHRQPFVVNDIKGIDYFTAILWNAAGQPDKTDWYLDSGVAKGKAMKLAEQKQAYAIWGAIPFLKYKQRQQSDLEILYTEDPLMQRVMAITRVNPEKFAGIHATAAKKLQDYLLSPETQAKISQFRSPGSDRQFWWPAGRFN